MKYNKGFTLIELLVVIAIIGLLSSVVLASLNNARLKGRDARRLADMRQIRQALDFYYDKYGQYPLPTSVNGGWEESFEDGGMFLEVLDPLHKKQYSYIMYK